jgi:hypothetical protein
MKSITTMKWKSMAWIAVTALAATTVRADDGGLKFPDNQLTFDAFGSYISGFKNFGDQFDHNWRHGDFGGGAGVNYFFMRYAGVGVDSFTYDEGQFFKNVTGNLILRYPIESLNLSPYIFGGGGRDFDPTDEWHEDAGVGLEYRFSRHIGVFADVRYIWEQKTENATLTRVGVRLGL